MDENSFGGVGTMWNDTSLEWVQGWMEDKKWNKPVSDMKFVHEAWLYKN